MKKILSALGVASMAAIFLLGTPAALASAPTATLSTPGGGITSITGNGATSGTEAGSHSIVVTDATASSLTGSDAESNTAADAIAVTLAGTETLTVTIAGETVTTGALAAATADVTTLADVATDIETKINAATSVADVAVTVVGSSPAKAFKVTVAVAGANNSITSTFSSTGAGPLGLTTSPVAGTNANAVDTFTAATGSNGLYIAAHPGGTNTVAHAPAAGTASTLAGLKVSLTAANAMINGITINAAGVLSAGTAVITEAAGSADATGSIRLTGTATVIAGVADEVTLTAYDDASNRATGYTGAKSLTFSGPGVLGSCTPTVEGTNLGSATSVTFASGVTNGTNATFLGCASADVSLDVTDGTATSTGDTSYDLDLTINPATVSNLYCLSGGQAGAINLNWTNPAGVNNGYEVKYYSDPISASNYAAATTYVQAFASGTVGSAHEEVLTGFNPGTRYHFAFKALGLNSNESGISNTMSCVAPPVGGSSYPDSQAPTSRITSPAANSTAPAGTPLVIKGTAKDNGTSSVQKVEVSVNGGLTWALATITNTDSANLIWEFTWANPSAGSQTIMVRATDWVNNVETPISQKITITSGTVVTTPSGVAAPGLQTAPGIQKKLTGAEINAQIATLRQQLIALLTQLLNQLIAQLAAKQ